MPQLRIREIVDYTAQITGTLCPSSLLAVAPFYYTNFVPTHLKSIAAPTGTQIQQVIATVSDNLIISHLGFFTTQVFEMSSAASSTSAASSATTTSCATQNYSAFPSKDVGCAVGGISGFNSSYGDILKSCCKTAPVDTWANDCALYCLSVDQTVGDLIKCWQDGGVKAADIYCSGNNTASATSKPSSSGTSRNGSGTQASATGHSSAAAPRSHLPLGVVNKAGLGMVAMVVISALFGVLL